MRSKDILFSNLGWRDVASNQLSAVTKYVNGMDGDRLLNTVIDDLVEYLVAEYSISIPSLHTDQIVTDQNEIQLDVSADPNRMIIDRDRPFHVAGTEIVVEVPFTGEADALRIQPTTYNMGPPRAEITSSALVLRISGTNLSADRVRREIDQTVAEIETSLVRLRTDAAGLASQLPTHARSAIETRRKKLLADRNLVGSLGFEIKSRKDSAKTYVTPEVRKKVSTPAPPASVTPFTPEPALSVDDYEHILGILQNMVHVMELSPSAFVDMNEESIRTHFLVQLNSQYEGQATGETFNFEGKTDILVRVDGKNVFIGECKFWSGPKALLETIDQILGYTSWRDTKVAVLVFNRNRDFSKVLNSIKETVSNHPKFKREASGSTETVFRYTFSNRDDPGRELQLTVLAFNVPIEA